eukprot:Rhum_TRINITY_DN235_c0_g2::Rhum_TRINITY_DN235_c0_g2_i1::g.674::m.674/K17278/PGRMC1_2; membrane-associated progesterone receptor component
MPNAADLGDGAPSPVSAEEDSVIARAIATMTASDWMILAAFAVAAYIWIVGGRNRKAEMARRLKERKETELRMYMEPRNDWTIAELAPHTGGPEEPTSAHTPILFAAKGTVFNVWRGRHFYGPEGSYHCFAGKDATIMLALELLDDPTPEQLAHPLSRVELGTLDDWFDTMAWKYDDVGKLAPGEGIWQAEPEKRRLWDIEVAKRAPVLYAAALAIVSSAAASSAIEAPPASKATSAKE